METESQPAVDLVVATLGRTDELERFLGSVAAQSYENVRVVLVDQNDDDRLEGLLRDWGGRPAIVRLRSQPGLSRARNVALPHLSGDIVAFPDDDCWYPPGLLREVVGRLGAHPQWQGLCVSARDGQGRSSSMMWDGSPGPLDRFNIWRRAISFTIFLRTPVVSTVGGFSEELGLGSGTRWGSGEESDYLLRALDAGFLLQYEPSLYVNHESPLPAFSKRESRGAYLRGLGHGHVLRSHGYPLWFAVFRVAQLVAGSAVFLVAGRPAKARYYLAMALGRARGWVSSARA